MSEVTLKLLYPPALTFPRVGRFRNDIPDVPFEPKLLTHPDDPLNHLTQYKPTVHPKPETQNPEFKHAVHPKPGIRNPKS